MPNIGPGSASVVVFKITGIEDYNGISIDDKLKCLFGSGKLKYSTGYSKVGKDGTCVWNSSTTINLKTDEQMKFKVKSKNTTFTCQSSINVYNISHDCPDTIELQCFVPVKSGSWRSLKKSHHARNPSSGSISSEQQQLSQPLEMIPLKLHVRVQGDIDFFHLQQKKSSTSNIANIFRRRGGPNKSPNPCRSAPNTPEHFDIKSISSLASISACKQDKKNAAEITTPLHSIRRKLSYDSSESSKDLQHNDLTISTESHTHNSFEHFEISDPISEHSKEASVDLDILPAKQCCLNKFSDIQMLQAKLSHLDLENEDLVSAIKILRSKVRALEQGAECTS